MAFGADRVEFDSETGFYKTRCYSFQVRLNKWMRLDFNPVVTLLSAIIIWGFVIWCIVKPEHAFSTMEPWMTWITETWCWFYVATQDIWAIFIIAIYFSKYGSMKLGKDDEQPEYSDTSYFAMLFAAGIGIGLFYFGVSEPVYHYLPVNRYYGRFTDNLRAQDAINITLFHWGIHAWIAYVVIGLNLGFIAYRWDMPMTIRTCFYPIIGDKIYGIWGDLIDVLSVVATMFGVCTSLGIGVGQLNAGISRLNSDIEVSTDNKVIIIWVITAVATVSVITGVKVGIRRLSETCFGLGMFIMLICFFYDETWYLLNVFVQSTGYYIQNIIQLGFHTDAFTLQGNAPDGKQYTTWMNDWTIFYWGWWIAWSPFVGMFIAKISRGRTVRQFIMYTMTIPVIYGFLWFSIFGGIGLKMERDAEIAGIGCYGPCGGKNSTTSCSNNLYRLSCRDSNDRWFDVMESYDGLGTFLSVLSIIGLVLYFVTSSDSGSLVIDCMSANGSPDPPVIQRVFWACTEGATATGLLVAGGSNSLKALQVVAIASGLPYTIILNFMCVSLWRSLRVEAGELDPNRPSFSVDLLDTFAELKHIPHLLKAVVCPWYYLGKAYANFGDKKRIATVFVMLTGAVLFYLFIALLVAGGFYSGLSYVGWAVYIGFATYCTSFRIDYREKFEINGNMSEDFFAMLLFYPGTIYQLYHMGNHAEDEVFRKKNDVPMYSNPHAIEAAQEDAPNYNGLPSETKTRIYSVSEESTRI